MHQYQYQQPANDSPQQPLRTNEELNLAVLRRHDSSIATILSHAPYAVVYVFSPATRQWEKNGVEGTLFVCQHAPASLGEERYSIFVLNRRGLDNFNVPLTDEDNVELTEEYVILKSDSSSELNTAAIVNTAVASNYNVNVDNTRGFNSILRRNGKDEETRIYGLWIYSEPPPNSTSEARIVNARVIRECAAYASQSRKRAQDTVLQNGTRLAATAVSSTADPVGGVQPNAPVWQQLPGVAAPPEPQQNVLEELFRKAGLAYQNGRYT